MNLDSRYAWVCGDGDYHEKYYNHKDVAEGKKFIVRDYFLGKDFQFPRFEREEGHPMGRGRVMVDSSLWNEKFFLWGSKTSPDFCSLVPKEFLSPDVVDVAARNASSYDFVKNAPHISKEQAAMIVERFPEAVSEIPVEAISTDMIDIVARVAPERLIHFEKEDISFELRMSCYERVSARIKKQFVEIGLMDGLLTAEDLNELVEDGVVFERERFHTSLLNFQFWRKVPGDLITDHIAEKMINKDSDYIRYVPDEKITKEMCYKAVRDNKSNIAYVPAKYQSYDIQKIAIDKDCKVVSLIPDECLTDEIIRYAVNIDGIALRGIPNLMKTQEICELAVSKNAKALPFVPVQYRTYELCLHAVTYAPYLIKYVPSLVLTNSFYNELKDRKVSIPSNCREYVEMCLAANEGAVTDDDLVIDKSKVSRSDSNIDLNNIYINNLADFFSPKARELLDANKICTVADLFEMADKRDFATYLGYYKAFPEINNSIRMLKCKYLNERPLFDIDDREMDMNEFYTLLGLSTRTKKRLFNSGFASTPLEFFSLMRNSEVGDMLISIRGMGESAVNEIIQKSSIVLDYFDNLKQEDNIEFLNDSINEVDDVSSGMNSDSSVLLSLTQELHRLEAEKNKIDSQINCVLRAIQDKKNSQIIGGK